MSESKDRGCRDITEDEGMYELVVFECDQCGFHFGIDLSWLEQTCDDGLEMSCPCCNNKLFIAACEG